MADEDLRALLGRYPSGVCIVTVDAGGQKLGLTVGSLVSLSLEPPLVGFAVSRDAAMHELLREAGGCAISLLAAGQEWLAQHFARGVPPIAMWHGVATSDGASFFGVGRHPSIVTASLEAVLCAVNRVAWVGASASAPLP